MRGKWNGDEIMVENLLKVFDDLKAQDVLVMELPEDAVSSKMVIVSGTSIRHVATLAEKARLYLRNTDVPCLSLIHI